MFLNGPCLNAAKEKNINAIVKMTDTRRELYKDASKLFGIQKPKREYEIVEVIENKKTKYSKKMKNIMCRIILKKANCYKRRN